MARKNKLGNSFCGLALEPREEVMVKQYLKEKDISAKQYLRYLVRKHLKEQTL